MAKRRSRAFVCVVALALSAACRRPPSPRPIESGSSAETAAVVESNATVTHLVDGDTIDVSVHGRHERVRLIGIDTPETKDPDKPVQCYGPEASALTASLLPIGTPVRLERDTEPRDDYGRLLAYVYRSHDGLFVNLELARVGAAVALPIQPNTTFGNVIAAAVAEARATRRGLWGACR